MIRFRNVVKRFGSKTVLNNISFEIPVGQIVFVIGKSGTGKSVMLKSIVGILSVDAGEIWVGNTDVTKITESEFHPIRKICGMVFQFPALLDSLSVFDNLAFGIRSLKLATDESEIADRVEKVIQHVHLKKDVLKRFPGELSFGTQKRVSIARTLAVEPSYLLFDEPTTGLDPVSTTAVTELIRELSKTLNVTSIVVSHDMHCALDISDRILFLDSGRLLADAPPRELLQSDELLVRQFLSSAKEHGARL